MVAPWEPTGVEHAQLQLHRQTTPTRHQEDMYFRAEIIQTCFETKKWLGITAGIGGRSAMMSTLSGDV